MSKSEENIGTAILKVALASAVSFFVWKVLQAAVGEDIDRRIRERNAQKA